MKQWNSASSLLCANSTIESVLHPSGRGQRSRQRVGKKEPMMGAFLPALRRVLWHCGMLIPLGCTAAMLCCIWYSMKVTPGTLMFKYQRPEVLNGMLLPHSSFFDPLGKSYPQCIYATPSNLILEGKVMRISSPAAPAPEMNKSCIATGSLCPLGSGDSGSLRVGK